MAIVLLWAFCGVLEISSDRPTMLPPVLSSAAPCACAGTTSTQIKENMKALDVLPKLKPEHIEFVSGVADHVASYRPR